MPNVIRREFVNTVLFFYFIFSLIFSVTFSGLLKSLFNFTYADEIIYLLLVLLWLLFFRRKRIILILVGILCFYFLYSILIHSNVLPALLFDFLVQSKPYMSFLICYISAPIFSKKERQLFRWTCLFLYSFLLLFGLFAVVSGDVRMFMVAYFSDTGSAFSSAVIIISLFYLINTKMSFRDKFLFLMMISLAFISAKSRFYGFYLISWFVFFFGKWIKIRFSFKNILLLFLAAVISITLTWNKIQSNFLLAGVNDDGESARFALYNKSIFIFKDYFPFGSGLASFGTEASRAYYSKIYVEYDLSTVWGMSKANDAFITDTFLPSLAEFGVIGFILFLLFCGKIF